MAKAELNRDAIVERALQIADTEGLDAITIRRVSKEFGVTPMALYWHVQNKEELLDAMGDRIFTLVQLGDEDETARWDDQLRDIVVCLVAAFRQHPTSLELVFRRILASVDGRAITERTLRLLRRAGFGPRETADLATYALQTALMLVSAEPGAQPGRTTDDVSAKLAEKRAGLAQLPVEQFPYLREMAEDLLHCHGMQTYYDFCIELFVAGARAALSRAGDKIGA